MDRRSEIIKVVSLDDGILHLSLNRPDQLNALNHDILLRLSHLLTEVKQDAAVKAILLSGEGKAFCAGADIKELTALNGATGLEFARFGQSVFNLLEDLGKPSLSAIHGYAFGGGCELAMSTTLRIAADTAVFSQPEIKLGVIPGFGGTQRLARLVGKGRALDLCLTGRRFSAQQAFDWGMLSEVTSLELLVPRAKALLSSLTSLGAVALQGIMSVINKGYDLPLQDAQELEATHFSICCATKDKQEGVSAFIEKRSPQFTGK